MTLTAVERSEVEEALFALREQMQSVMAIPPIDVTRRVEWLARSERELLRLERLLASEAKQ